MSRQSLALGRDFYVATKCFHVKIKFWSRPRAFMS